MKLLFEPSGLDDILHHKRCQVRPTCFTLLVCQKNSRLCFSHSYFLEIGWTFILIWNSLDRPVMLTMFYAICLNTNFVCISRGYCSRFQTIVTPGASHPHFSYTYSMSETKNSFGFLYSCFYNHGCLFWYPKFAFNVSWSLTSPPVWKMFSWIENLILVTRRPL